MTCVPPSSGTLIEDGKVTPIATGAANVAPPEKWQAKRSREQRRLQVRLHRLSLLLTEPSQSSQKRGPEELKRPPMARSAARQSRPKNLSVNACPKTKRHDASKFMRDLFWVLDDYQMRRRSSLWNNHTKMFPMRNCLQMEQP